MKGFYIVRNEILGKNKEKISVVCWYKGCDYASALSVYCDYASDYVVDKSEIECSGNIYYDYIYMLKFEVSEIALEDFDFDDFDDYICNLEKSGKGIIIHSNFDGDFND